MSLIVAGTGILSVVLFVKGYISGLRETEEDISVTGAVMGNISISS